MNSQAFVTAKEVLVQIVTEDGKMINYKFGEGDSSRTISLGIEAQTEYDNISYDGVLTKSFVTSKRTVFTVGA